MHLKTNAFHCIILTCCFLWNQGLELRSNGLKQFISMHNYCFQQECTIFLGRLKLKPQKRISICDQNRICGIIALVEWIISQYMVTKQSEKSGSITDSLTIIFQNHFWCSILLPMFSFLSEIPHLSPTPNVLFSLEMLAMKGTRIYHHKICLIGILVILS